MKKKKLTTSELVAATAAHEAATEGKTPQIARHALLAQPVKVGGYTVHPPSLATQILLEEIDHPILKAAAATTEEEAAAIPFGSRDILTLIFIFTQPEEAWRTIGMSKENFAASARDFALGVPPTVVAELVPAIQKMMTTASRTVPADSAGGDQKTAGGRDPLA